MREPRDLPAVRRWINATIGLAVVALLSAGSAAAAWGAATAMHAIPVPLESSLYDDLEHFRALGWWRGSLEARPVPRDVFTGAVASIRLAMADRRMPSRDELRLRRMERAVGAWTNGSPQEDPAPRGAWPPVRTEITAALHTVGTLSDLTRPADLDRRPRREQFFLLSSDIGAGEHAFLHWRFYEDYDRLTPFRPGDRWADNFPPGLRKVFTAPSARNDQAILGVAWGWGSVEFGRQDRHWGPGRHGTLFVSENPFPLDGISARFETRYLAGTSLLAQLRRGNDVSPEPLPARSSTVAVTVGDGWMATHRIEVRPPGPVRVGLYEAVAWSGRGIDLGYANPVALLLAVNQDLFDRTGIDDKKVVGADFSADLAPVSVYGEVLVNRVVTLDANQGPNSDATTWAQLLGMRWADPLGIGGADLDVEYAHLDPEVYFHKDGDLGRSFVEDSVVVGHWLGPNADSFKARVGLPAGERFGSVGLSFERARWGVIDGLRGTEIGFFHLRKRDKRWITGRIEEERILMLDWKREAMRLLPSVFLDAETRLARVDRSGMDLRDGWQAEIRITCRAALEVNE